jgi:hypothetical protein
MDDFSPNNPELLLFGRVEEDPNDGADPDPRPEDFPNTEVFAVLVTVG